MAQGYRSVVEQRETRIYLKRLAALSVLLLLMCTPYENDFLPVTWYLFSLSSLPSVSVSLLSVFKSHLGCFNALPAELQQNFLQGVLTEYSLAFILAVLFPLVFACSIWCAFIIAVNGLSPLAFAGADRSVNAPTQLSSLEQAPEQEAGKSFCCLRIDILSL